MLGHKEVLDGIKNRIWILYQTDKSGKMVLDTKENFLESMKPHYQEHRKSNLEEVAKSERHLSNHSKCWAQFIGIGINAGEFQSQRIMKALNVEYCDIPG